ncbi:hypothetical protein [Pseudovibrio sp. JE062]|uniref:hypothetical protein n=1 Tax=Pseudovibrio sp. JE062 TaxID=439495 RepID=UPI000186C62B|nr:hypothetical protein [Pseudovibrio sp. JE062]EEA95878.1 hypothetical protein PJE062_4917 [Pseudovibrio sp. JE062]
MLNSLIRSYKGQKYFLLDPYIAQHNLIQLRIFEVLTGLLIVSNCYLAYSGAYADGTFLPPQVVIELMQSVLPFLGDLAAQAQTPKQQALAVGQTTFLGFSFLIVLVTPVLGGLVMDVERKTRLAVPKVMAFVGSMGYAMYKILNASEVVLFSEGGQIRTLDLSEARPVELGNRGTLLQPDIITDVMTAGWFPYVVLGLLIHGLAWIAHRAFIALRLL